MPIARPDQVATSPGMPIIFDPLANDDGQELTLVAVSAPAHGQASGDGSGRITYTPEPGFAGSDAFTYTVRDATGQSATGTVQLVVDTGPVAVDDVAVAAATSAAAANLGAGSGVDGQVPADAGTAIPVLANDRDAENDPLGIVALGQPGHGAVTLEPGGNAVRYTPEAGFTGVDSFVYTVADPAGAAASATVTITVAGLNRSPVAQRQAVTTTLNAPVTVQPASLASDPDADPLTLVALGLPAYGRIAVNPDRSIVYTPNPGHLGADSFTCTLDDGRGGRVASEVAISVIRLNTAPVARPDSAVTTSGVPVTVAVLANDLDPDGDPLLLQALTLPAHGAIAVNDDRTITYTPEPGFAGADGFTYTLSDGQGSDGIGALASGTVTITVAPPAVAPVYANGFSCRRRLVLPASPTSAETLTNFVLLVDETGPWLKDTAHGGKVASAQGFDFRFTTEDGTVLDHEIDRYDPGTGLLTAWVRLPAWTLSEDLRLFLYYGRPGLTSGAAPQAVWAAALAAIDPGTGADLSGHGHDLAASGVSPVRLKGRAGRLDGTASTLTGTVPSWLNGLSGFTLTAWAQSEVAGDERGLLTIGAFPTSDTSAGFVLRHQGQGSAGQASAWLAKGRFSDLADVRLETAARTAGTEPVLVALTWTAGEGLRLFLNGDEAAQAVATGQPGGRTAFGNGKLRLGSGVAAGSVWQGSIGRLVIYDNPLPPVALAQAFKNQSVPAGFYGLGGEDQAGEPNQAPVAVPLAATTTPGDPLDLDVLGRGLEPDPGDSLSIAAIGQPSHGSVGAVDGRVRYAPVAGFTGSDSFTFTLSDGRKTSTGLATITVRPTGGGIITAPASSPTGGPVSDPIGGPVSSTVADVWNAGPRSRLPFWSGASQSGVADTESLRGRQLDLVTVFGTRDTWFDVQGGTQGGTTLDGWFAGYFAQYYTAQMAMVLSYPYFPANAGVKGTAAYIAANKGAYDDYWRAWSRKLKLLRKARPGLPAPIIRPGWEMNGTSSYPWYIGDTDPDLYKAVWQRLVAILRADHTDAPICWCTLKGNHLPNKMSVYYPGDASVDLIGVDYYANSMNPVPTSAASFATFAALGSADDPKGLYQWLAFAQKRGKKLCLPEWGIALTSGDLEGALGDLPYFIQGIWDFIATNQGKIAFESCFNQGRNFLSPNEAPKSRQRYRDRWGSRQG